MHEPESKVKVFERRFLELMLNEFLVYECKVISEELAAYIDLIDSKHTYTHIEKTGTGEHVLWHKHLYLRSEEKRQKSRQLIQEAKKLADKRDEIRSTVVSAVNEMFPDDKQFKKIREAMVNKLMANKADELAKALGLDLSDIPEVNFWKL